MPGFAPPEQRSFVCFIFVTLITAVLLSLSTNSLWPQGVSLLLWGGFGLWRLSVLSERLQHFYERLNILPARLMASLKNREKKARNFAHDRLESTNVRLWLSFSGAYLVWIIVKSKISTPDYLNEETTDFFNAIGIESKPSFLSTNDLREAAYFLSFFLMILLAQSYAYAKQAIKQASIFFLPSAAYLVYVCFFSAKNMGEGFAEDKIEIVNAGFMLFLFSPFLYAFLRMSVWLRFNLGPALEGLVCLAVIGAALIIGPPGGAVFCLGALTALCWGQASLKRPLDAPVLPERL